MNQRRFVVEIARPVPVDDVEQAAAYVARRLGMDETRIRTLLSGRTGPVTRDVLADKAEAIAKVFSEAGVMVTVVERSGGPEGAERSAPAERPARPGPQPAAEPRADHEYGGPADAGTGRDAGEDYPGAVDLRLASTRWVPSPHDDPVDAGSPDAADTAPSRDRDTAHAYPDDYAEHFDDDAKADFADDIAGHRGLWLAPDPPPAAGQGASPHDGLDDAEPHEHPRLRTYLLWALVVSIVLLGVLQLVFSASGPSASGATYEAGLGPYRSGDFGAARSAWQAAAENGDPRAQYMLGYLVQNGLGQPWSNRRAAEWYELAAARGVPEAQAALANLYLEGLGVQPDAERGVALLREAAAAGHPPALEQYAELLFHGHWVDQDFGAALAAFEAAAAGGSEEAADYVGLARYLEAGRASRPSAED